MTVQRVICGDNLKILKKLEDESVDLIYIDPPFFTQKNYEIIWNDGAEIRQFGDRWITEKSNGTGRASKDINVYLEWMKPRIEELHRVLKKTGSFYLHCDKSANSYLRMICDEIFGRNNFRNEIIWHYTKMNQSSKIWIQNHDNIYFYTKTLTWNFNVLRIDVESALKKRFKKYICNDNMLRWKNIKNLNQQLLNSYINTSKKRLGRNLQDEDIIINFNEKGQQKIDDVWYIPIIKGNSKEYLGYPTQKPEALLERIINASSNEGDVVLDAFAGCGTTLAVAKKLGRQFIGIDVSATACRLVVKRLGMPIKTVEGLPITKKEIATMDGFEFQNWIIREFGGFSGNRGADGGIDGTLGECLIQVKKYKAGRNDLDAFVGVLLREKKEEGLFIAIDFSVDFRREVARLKRENEIIIHAFSIEDVINEKHHEVVRKFIPKKGLEMYL